GRVRLFEEGNGIESDDPIRFSPDGKIIVKNGSYAIEVVETSTATVRGRLRRYEPAWSVSFHPSGKVFAVTEHARLTILSYDAGKVRLLRRWELSPKVFINPLDDYPACPFVPGGNLLAIPGDGGSVDLWDWTTGR